MTLSVEKQKTIARVAEILLPLPLPPRAVVVFDIDDTLISEQGVPMTPILRFYLYCKSQGLKTAIVTARRDTEEVRRWTERQLAELGVFAYDFIYYMPPEALSAHRFKQEARRDLWMQGCRVIMTVGDQEWDHGLYGGIPIFVR